MMSSVSSPKPREEPHVVVTEKRRGMRLWVLLLSVVLWGGLFLMQLLLLVLEGGEFAPGALSLLALVAGAGLIGLQLYLLPGAGPTPVLIVSDFGLQSANSHWNGMWVRWRDVACIEAYDERRGSLRSPAKLVFWDAEGQRSSLPLLLPERDGAQRQALFKALNHYWPGWDRPCGEQPRASNARRVAGQAAR